MIQTKKNLVSKGNSYAMKKNRVIHFTGLQFVRAIKLSAESEIIDFETCRIRVAVYFDDKKEAPYYYFFLHTYIGHWKKFDSNSLEIRIPPGVEIAEIVLSSEYEDLDQLLVEMLPKEVVADKQVTWYQVSI